MKKISIFLIIIFCGLIVKAQQGNIYGLTLKNETPLKHKVFIGNFKDAGSTGDLDVNGIIKEHFNEYKGEAGKINISDYKKCIVTVSSTDEADVVLSGTYTFNQSTLVDEKYLQERSNSYAYKMPYFEVRPANTTDLTVVFEYKYADGTAKTDTLFEEWESEKKEGKGLRSLDALKNDASSSLNSKLYDLSYVASTKNEWAKFKKVKVKDKALKEQYKERQDLFDEDKIKELGQLYKKIYESKPSPEAAHCIGMCYELLGNYPKAMEYYKKLPDFATNSRMKKNMEVFNYLKEMGCEMELVEF